MLQCVGRRTIRMSSRQLSGQEQDHYMSGGNHEELTEVLDSEYIHILNPNPLTLTPDHLTLPYVMNECGMHFACQNL